MELYKHTPLGHANSIRFLRLEPALKASTPLKISIYETPLASAPPYEALSYSWGSSNPPCLVTVRSGHQQERALTVTANCEAALRRLRRRLRVRVLWIDAICIDQTSADDKNAQVPMMRDIYAAAAGVVVWLGEPASAPGSSPGAGGVAELFRLMSLAGTLYPYGLLRIVSRFEDSPHENMLGRAVEDYLAPRTVALKAELLELLRNAYFQRVWTMQEIAMAPKDAITVQVGGSRIFFRDLCVATAFARVSLSLISGFSLDTIDKDFRDLESRMLQCCLRSHFVLLDEGDLYRLLDKGGSVLSSVALPDLDIIRYAKGLHSTDPKDKVYASIFVFSESELLGEGPQRFTVDYNKPVHTIYTEFTTFLFRYKAGKHFIWPLLIASGDRAGCSDDLPSWVPDWADTTSHFAHLEVARVFPNDVLDETALRFELDQDRLCLWGRRHSSIIGVFEVSGKVFPSILGENDTPRMQMFERCRGLKVVSDLLLQSYARTRTADNQSQAALSRFEASMRFQLTRCAYPHRYVGPDKKTAEAWAGPSTAQEEGLIFSMGTDIYSIRLKLVQDLLRVRMNIGGDGEEDRIGSWVRGFTELLRTYLGEETLDTIKQSFLSDSDLATFRKLVGPPMRPFLDVSVLSYYLSDFIKTDSIISSFTHGSTHQAYFVTEAGQIGRTTTNVKVGDFVTTWQGTDVPFVLRPSAGEYESKNTKEWTLASAAYVPNLWNAESEARDQGYPGDEMFVIV